MTLPGRDGRLMLVRHPPVAAAWRARCYGATDVPLGREGRSSARGLASELADWKPDVVLTSPLRRARWLAGLVARRIDVAVRVDARLSERDFGTWEGRTWDDIHAETGDAMMGMLTAPDTFRPGGGETTAELCNRTLAWYRALPAGRDVLAVCHGGPIAALVGTARGAEPKDWGRFIPPPGMSIEMPELD